MIFQNIEKIPEYKMISLFFGVAKKMCHVSTEAMDGRAGVPGVNRRLADDCTPG